MTLPFRGGNLIKEEYDFGLKNFQDRIQAAQENITESEVNFLNDHINLIVMLGENITLQSRELFENFGFVVDAKRVFLFVSEVRTRIKDGIARLMNEFSANQIKRNFSRIYQRYSLNLKNIFDKEIARIQYAVHRDVNFMECWDAYKLPIFELGFEVVQDLTILSLTEAETLSQFFVQMRRDVATKTNKLISDLSMRHSTLFSTRLRVNTYVSLLINYVTKWATSPTTCVCAWIKPFFLIADRRQSKRDSRSNRWLVPTNCYFTSTSDQKCSAWSRGERPKGCQSIRRLEPRDRWLYHRMNLRVVIAFLYLLFPCRCIHTRNVSHNSICTNRYAVRWMKEIYSDKQRWVCDEKEFQASNSWRAYDIDDNYRWVSHVTSDARLAVKCWCENYNSNWSELTCVGLQIESASEHDNLISCRGTMEDEITVWLVNLISLC